MKWSVYNQSLGRRGEILIGFDVIDNWDIELKEMNEDKVGLGTVSLSYIFLLLLGYVKHISIGHLDKPKKVLHKAMLKEKYLQFLTLLQ
jgi:hypothetical protein